MLTRNRYFAPGVFLAYVVFATAVAGAVSSGAGMAVLVAGLFAALVLDHARWHRDEKDRTSLAAPFRPDPYGLRRDASTAASPSDAAPGSPAAA